MKKLRNKHINEITAYYNKRQQRSVIAEKLKQESKLVAKNSMAVLRVFEEVDSINE